MLYSGYMKWVLSLLCVLPSVAFAGTGFVEDSIWLSRTTITEGESVIIYAALVNNDTSPFTGTARFSEGTQEIGRVPVSVETDEATVVSISRKPDSGEHTVMVEIASSSVSLADATK